MLALASLHQAYLRPLEAESYEVLAVPHHNLALTLFRDALTSITEYNCHALYACGHLVIKYVFASPQSRLGLVFPAKVGNISEFIILLRGSFSVHDHALKWLSDGPLGFCLERPLDENPNFNRNPDDSHLARLLSHLLTESSEDVQVCCGALNNLRRLLAMDATPGQTISTKTLAYSWPARVSQRYIVLVSERRPEALVVLAHYCVLLKRIDSFWFMRGCALMILKQCLQDLDHSWEPYVKWPISVVGLEGD
jgi:hypothetical protein